VLSNTSTGSGPLSYQWDFGDGSTSAELAPRHTYARTGLYTVALTATNVLSASRTSQVIILPPILYYWPVYFR
jgi:PKD repeat protein